MSCLPRSLSAIFLLALALVTGLLGHAAQGGGLSLDEPWVRLTIPGRPAAGYVKIRNSGGQDDAIVSASSAMAERVELHTHIMEGSVMKMRPAKEIAVPAGTGAELKPGGHHLMIFGLDAGVKPGSEIPLVLTFRKSGRVEGRFMVRGLSDKNPSNQSGHHHKH